MSLLQQLMSPLLGSSAVTPVAAHPIFSFNANLCFAVGIHHANARCAPAFRPCEHTPSTLASLTSASPNPSPASSLEHFERAYGIQMIVAKSLGLRARLGLISRPVLTQEPQIRILATTEDVTSITPITPASQMLPTTPEGGQYIPYTPHRPRFAAATPPQIQWRATANSDSPWTAHPSPPDLLQLFNPRFPKFDQENVIRSRRLALPAPEVNLGSSPSPNRRSPARYPALISPIGSHNIWAQTADSEDVALPPIDSSRAYRGPSSDMRLPSPHELAPQLSRSPFYNHIVPEPTRSVHVFDNIPMPPTPSSPFESCRVYPPMTPETSSHLAPPTPFGPIGSGRARSPSTLHMNDMPGSPAPALHAPLTPTYLAPLGSPYGAIGNGRPGGASGANHNNVDVSPRSLAPAFDAPVFTRSPSPVRPCGVFGAIGSGRPRGRPSPMNGPLNMEYRRQASPVKHSRLVPDPPSDSVILHARFDAVAHEHPSIDRITNDLYPSPFALQSPFELCNNAGPSNANAGAKEPSQTNDALWPGVALAPAYQPPPLHPPGLPIPSRLRGRLPPMYKSISPPSAPKRRALELSQQPPTVLDLPDAVDQRPLSPIDCGIAPFDNSAGFGQPMARQEVHDHAPLPVQVPFRDPYNVNRERYPDMVVRDTTIYNVLGTLGEGGFGRVFLAMTNKLEAVALKVVHKRRCDQSGSTRRTIAFERNCMALAAEEGLPFWMRLREAWDDDLNIYFAMDPCVTTLRQRINEARRGMSMSKHELRLVCAEMLLAFRDLRDRQVVHCDIKPDNFLITHTGRVVLSDFGLGHSPSPRLDKNVKGRAAQLDTAGFLRWEAPYWGGTDAYTAPEVKDEKHCTHATDIWSLGVVFLELMCTKFDPLGGVLKTDSNAPPSQYPGGTAAWRAVTRSQRLSWLVDTQAPSWLSTKSQEWSICSEMILHHTTTSVEKLMGHPFFEGLDFDEVYAGSIPHEHPSANISLKIDEESRDLTFKAWNVRHNSNNAHDRGCRESQLSRRCEGGRYDGRYNENVQDHMYLSDFAWPS